MKSVVKLSVLSWIVSVVAPAAAFAQETAAAASSEGRGLGLIAAALAIGVAAFGGTMAQGRAVCSNLEAIGRNPGASGNLFVPMLLGLAFIESLVVISFVIAFTIVGKL